jgi:proteasome alpha subunit
MSMPFYVAPEQVMKDRADYARKGIARGRSLAAVVYADGILMCAENPSSTLRKISEIYDRIAFAGVGKYNEFDQLRIAGVRAADLKGYSYSREDVDARSLANNYAQILGQIFTHEMKPMEVEILVAEVGEQPGDDQMFHILYDGTVMDEKGYTVLGGEADVIAGRLRETYREGLSLDDALRVTVAALAGDERTIAANELEAAALARSNGRRAFRRIDQADLARLFPGAAGAGDEPPGGSAGQRPESETGQRPESETGQRPESETGQRPESETGQPEGPEGPAGA